MNRKQNKSSGISYNQEAQTQLWQISEKLTGLVFQGV
jgi:hypothetical protein